MYIKKNIPMPTLLYKSREIEHDKNVLHSVNFEGKFSQVHSIGTFNMLLIRVISDNLLHNRTSARDSFAKLLVIVPQCMYSL